MKRSSDMENEGVLQIACAMVVAARTAPKTRGIDNIEVIVIDDEPSKDKVREVMAKISKDENRPSFERDANSIKMCPAIVAIGVKAIPAGLNCGFCGYGTCDKLKKSGGICAYNSIDLGIAVSSAASCASDCRADNRVMYSIGRACLDLKLFTHDVKQALGIPLSVTGKSPFFDRK